MTMLPFETNIVWVKADLKGLGEDGTLTDNADTEEVVDGKTKTVYHMAGLFGDDTDTFVAYSWQILGQLAMDDWTNTKDLLIALTYQEHSHTYANSENPWQGQNLEPDEFHFSLVEVYGALSLEIKNGNADYYVNLPEGTEKATCTITFKFNPTANFENGYQVDCEVEIVNLVTAISSVNSTADAATVYNLAGQRMNGLQKGINIVNGKKMVVK